MTNGYRKHPTLYVGVTSDLEKRSYEHKNKLFRGFTSRYNLDKLVYFESSSDINEAITREKQLKNWHREWKLNLIRQSNPDLNDLASEIPKQVRDDKGKLSVN